MQNKQYKLTISFIISSLIFLTIIFSVFTKSLWTHILDLQSFQWFLNTFGEPKMNFKGNLFNDLMTFLATYGDIATFIALTLIVAAIALIKRHLLLAIWLPATVASAGIVGIALKDIVHRSRPYDHLAIDTGFSFPSGHSLTSTIVIFALIFVFIPKIKHLWIKRLLNTGLIVVWLGILFSRLYFHAHYLTDVVGGVLFSFSWLLMSMMIYQYILQKVNHRTSLQQKRQLLQSNRNYHKQRTNY